MDSAILNHTQPIAPAPPLTPLPPTYSCPPISRFEKKCIQRAFGVDELLHQYYPGAQ